MTRKLRSVNPFVHAHAARRADERGRKSLNAYVTLLETGTAEQVDAEHILRGLAIRFENIRREVAFREWQVNTQILRGKSS